VRAAQSSNNCSMRCNRFVLLYKAEGGTGAATANDDRPVSNIGPREFTCCEAQSYRAALYLLEPPGHLFFLHSHRPFLLCRIRRPGMVTFPM